MAGARKIGMLLVGLFAFCAFSWQASACFVERSGLVTCPEHHDEPAPSAETSCGDCCHVESTGNFVQTRVAAPMAAREPHVLAPGRMAPDAPILEIEHPPKLS